MEFTTIPAQPGWWAHYGGTDWWCPVIAWRIDEGGGIAPVVIDDTDNTDTWLGTDAGVYRGSPEHLCYDATRRPTIWATE